MSECVCMTVHISCKGPYYNTFQVHCVYRTQRGLVFAQGFVSNLTLTMSRGDLPINTTVSYYVITQYSRGKMLTLFP